MLARSMQNPKQIVCKRVLGLEGDEVRVAPSTQLGEGKIVKVIASFCWSALQQMKSHSLSFSTNPCK